VTVNFLEPEYNLPCRQPFCAHLDGLKTEVAKSVQADMASASSETITTDIWTSMTEPYISLTESYITPNRQLVWRSLSNIYATLTFQIRVLSLGASCRCLSCLSRPITYICSKISGLYIHFRAGRMRYALQIRLDSSYLLCMFIFRNSVTYIFFVCLFFNVTI